MDRIASDRNPSNRLGSDRKDRTGSTWIKSNQIGSLRTLRLEALWLRTLWLAPYSSGSYGFGPCGWRPSGLGTYRWLVWSLLVGTPWVPHAFATLWPTFDSWSNGDLQSAFGPAVTAAGSYTRPGGTLGWGARISHGYGTWSPTHCLGD